MRVSLSNEKQAKPAKQARQAKPAKQEKQTTPQKKQRVKAEDEDDE